MLWYFQFNSCAFRHRSSLVSRVCIRSVAISCLVVRFGPFPHVYQYMNGYSEWRIYVFQCLALSLIKTFLGAIAGCLLCAVCCARVCSRYTRPTRRMNSKCLGFCNVHDVRYHYIVYRVYVFTSHHCRHFRCSKWPWSLNVNASSCNCKKITSHGTNDVDVVVVVLFGNCWCYRPSSISLKWFVVCLLVRVRVWKRERESKSP